MKIFGTNASSRHAGRRQSGATAVEFAFVLPLLVGMFYAIFVYGYVFVLNQILNMAAEEGARAAVAVTTGGPAALAQQQAAATSTVNAELSFLPAAQRALIVGPTVASFITQGSTLQVTLSMTLTGLFPVIPLPLIGNVPQLPAALTVVSFD